MPTPESVHSGGAATVHHKSDAQLAPQEVRAQDARFPHMSGSNSQLVGRLTLATFLGSVLAAVCLSAAHVIFHSELALAQAADSLMDVGGAGVLAWTVRVARQPRDANHPLGHGRAEPLGALAMSMLAGVLAVEVVTSAVRSLLGEPVSVLSPWLLGFFLAKVAFKGVVFGVARDHKSPAVTALAVDARNDVLVGSVAVAGYFLADAGIPAVDAALSIPLGLYIAWSGVALARENIHLLMGGAPTTERQAELLALAASIPGVITADKLTAHFVGTELAVYIRVSVAADLSLHRAHDIGEAVRARIEAEADVLDCAVHLDPAATAS